MDCLALNSNDSNDSTVFLNLRAASRLVTGLEAGFSQYKACAREGPATTCFGDTADDVLFYYEVFGSVL